MVGGAGGTAWQYCTGPVNVFFGIITNPNFGLGYNSNVLSPVVTSPLYIGTCEQYPIVNGGVNWNPIFADDTGNMEPLDYEFQNQWKIIILELNKLVQVNVDQLFPPPVNGDFADFNTIGALLQGQGYYMQLWLQF